jgi:phospholipid/cholesterol/gamma-HCH transport system substrate-binding protein
VSPRGMDRERESGGSRATWDRDPSGAARTAFQLVERERESVVRTLADDHHSRQDRLADLLVITALMEVENTYLGGSRAEGAIRLPRAYGHYARERDRLAAWLSPRRQARVRSEAARRLDEVEAAVEDAVGGPEPVARAWEQARERILAAPRPNLLVAGASELGAAVGAALGRARALGQGTRGEVDGSERPATKPGKRQRRESRLPDWAVGLLTLIVIALGVYFAFTKSLPWADGYEVRAVFPTAQNLRVDSPVRIAGVEVGKVTEVEHLTTDDPSYPSAVEGTDVGRPQGEGSGVEAAVVTMEVEDEGRPIHEDATFQLRPRLFLEGNLFVDLRPGSPSAPEAEEGHTFPIQQTSNSVQLDQVLTTLQTDVRGQLQAFLDQFGNALVAHGGAAGLREAFRTSAGAFKNTSLVNQSLLGTEPHDLSGLIRNLDVVLRALGRDEAELQDLVSNFSVVSGSFAARDEALGRAVAELPDVLAAGQPAFDNLNAAFPPLRALAREALPGVRSATPAIDAATPFVGELRELVAEDELRGLVADLRPTIPRLARLTRSTGPFMEQTRALSSCFNEVVIPWSHDTVVPPPGYAHEPAGNVAEETAYGLVGIGAESRSGDANGQYIRVMGGGGANTVTVPGSSSDYGEDAFGLAPAPILGATPRIEDSAKTPFRPNVACELQEQPDLAAGTANPPQQSGVGG